MFYSFRYNKILEFLKEICYLGIIFFTPLYFALFLKNNNVFELNKLVLFKILVLILFFLTLLRQGFGGQAQLNKPNWSKYLIIPTIFLLVLSVSTIFSINKEVSFYGLANRLQGLNSYLYYFLFFILLLINVKSKEQINRVILSIVFSSFFVSIYGLIQAFGFDPLPWGESSKFRIFSTFGQPNLLSSYLLLTIPLSIYLILTSFRKASLTEDKGPWGINVIIKLFYFVILTSQLLCLFFTYSLSGWVGFIIGGVITTMIYLFLSFRPKRSEEPESRVSPYKHKNYFIRIRHSCGSLLDSCLCRNDKKGKYVPKIYFIIIFIVLLFILIIGGYYVYNKTNAKWTIAAKIQSLTNLQSGSFASRLNFWAASLKAIKKRPLFGYGPDTQADSLIKYYQRDWGVSEDINIRPDRAHNLFLDILLTTGIFGLLAFLALLYLFFKLIFKIIKSNSEFSVLAYFILFALLAYLFSLQLNFTFVVGEIYFWLYLTIIIVIARKPVAPADAAIPSQIENQTVLNDNFSICHSCPAICGINSGRNPESDSSNCSNEIEILHKTGFIKSAKIVLISGLAILISYLINNQIKLLTADYYFMQLRESRAANQYFGAIKMYEFIKEDIKKYGVYDRQFVSIMSPWLEEFANPGFKKYGEEKLAQILPQVKTDNYDDVYIKGKIYKTLANEEHKDYYDLAAVEFKKLIELSPELPNTYFELAKLYFKNQDYDQAILNYRTELNKLPEITNPNLNPAHGQVIKNELYKIYTGIGDSYLKKKNYNEAESTYLIILKIDERFIAAYASLAELSQEKGDLNKAIWYNKKGMEAEPGNYIWPLNLSKIYKSSGEKNLADEYLKKAQELAPN